MQEVNIYSKNNTFQRFEVLKTNRKKRYKYHEFFVEGVRSLKEAVQNDWKIKSLIYNKNHCSDWALHMIETTKSEVNYNLTEELMAALSGKEDTSELMAVVEMREDHLHSLKLSRNPFLVLFDRPSNKGNLGTMIRSCDALGADALILTGHAVDLYDPDVISATMGSFFNLPVIRISENQILFDYMKELKEIYSGFLTVGTTAHKEKVIYSVDFTNPVMLMIGNETMGLNKTFKESCDLLCTIPMADKSYASSFNVSCAASIVMYEIIRQRQKNSP